MSLLKVNKGRMNSFVARCGRPIKNKSQAVLPERILVGRLRL
jgi:hypothetical protein